MTEGGGLKTSSTTKGSVPWSGIVEAVLGAEPKVLVVLACVGDKVLDAVLASKFYARHCVITPSEKHEDGTVTLGEGTVLVCGPRLSVVLVTEQLWVPAQVTPPKQTP